MGTNLSDKNKATMILTGKAKEDFLEWIKSEKYPISKWALSTKKYDNRVLNALIIEWLDSIEIYVNILSFNKGSSWKSIADNIMIYEKFGSRKEATIEAIKKANEIYNEKFK